MSRQNYEAALENRSNCCGNEHSHLSGVVRRRFVQFLAQNPRYNDSWGFRPRYVWHINGPIQDFWLSTWRTQIRNVWHANRRGLYPRGGVEEEPEPLLYMVGFQRSTSSPLLVLVNARENVLKRAQSILVHDWDFQKYHRVIPIHIMTYIESRRLLAESSGPETEIVDLEQPKAEGSLLGLGIRHPGTEQRATLGGVVQFSRRDDSKFYGLTVKHVLFQDIHNDDDDEVKVDLFLDSYSEEDLDRIWGNDEDVELKSSEGEGIPPEQEPSEDLPQSVLELPDEHHPGTTTPGEVIPLGVHEKGTEDDWALINMDSILRPELLENVLNEAGSLKITKIAENPPEDEVIVFTARGTFHAMGMGVSSEGVTDEFLKARLENVFAYRRFMWMIQMQTDDLEKGDSGAWVVDSNTGDFYGILVSGRRTLRLGYLLPAREIIFEFLPPGCLFSFPTLSDNLVYAARHGYEKVVEKLVHIDKMDPNMTDSSGRSLLALAAAEGHEKTVQMLLKTGTGVDNKGNAYDSALNAAISGGHEALVQLLIDHSADVNFKGRKYDEGFVAALKGGHEAVIHLLINQGFDINAYSGEYGSALEAAAEGGSEGLVQLLIGQGAGVHAEGRNYNNALQAASAGGHEPVVKLLIHHGVDVNVRSGRYGNALQAASSKGHKTVVQTLLHNGADATRGYSLPAASENGNEEVVKMLLQNGADVNRGRPLVKASENGHKDVVQLLLNSGADVNLRILDRTALHAASERGHEEVVELLLKNGADPNAGPCLPAAAEKGHEKVVELLLEKGADVHTRGFDGMTALEAAQSGNHTKIVNLLRENGA